MRMFLTIIMMMAIMVVSCIACIDGGVSGPRNNSPTTTQDVPIVVNKGTDLSMTWYALRSFLNEDGTPFFPLQDGYMAVTSSRQMAVMFTLSMSTPYVYEVEPIDTPEPHPTVTPYLSDGEEAIIMRTKAVRILERFTPTEAEQIRYHEQMLKVEAILSRL